MGALAALMLLLGAAAIHHIALERHTDIKLSPFTELGPSTTFRRSSARQGLQFFCRQVSIFARHACFQFGGEFQVLFIKAPSAWARLSRLLVSRLPFGQSQRRLAFWWRSFRNISQWLYAGYGPGRLAHYQRVTLNLGCATSSRASDGKTTICSETGSLRSALNRWAKTSRSIYKRDGQKTSRPRVGVAWDVTGNAPPSFALAAASFTM